MLAWTHAQAIRFAAREVALSSKLAQAALGTLAAVGSGIALSADAGGVGLVIVGCPPAGLIIVAAGVATGVGFAGYGVYKYLRAKGEQKGSAG